MEESRVGLRELFQVGALDVLLIANAALRDAIHQHIDGRLQVHHEIRLRRIDHHTLVDAFVQRIFRIIERHARKQSIFLEQVVGNAHRAEQILLPHFLELAGTLEQEKQLGLKCSRARILVEPLEEGILLRLLEHQLAREGLRQSPREAGFADADRPLDDDEAVRGCAHMQALLLLQNTDSVRTRPHLHLPDTAVSRNVQRWRNIVERIQDEVALRHSGMRQPQPRLLDRRTDHPQEVEIDEPWPPALLPLATHPPLDIEEQPEQFPSCRLGQEADAALTKSGCSCGPIGRVRYMRERSSIRVPGERADPLARFEHPLSRLIEIAADRDIGGAPQRFHTP